MMNFFRMLKRVKGGAMFLLYKFRRNQVSITSEIGPHVHLRSCNIGKWCYIGNCSILNSVSVGNYTCIAPGVQVGGMEHSYWNLSTSPRLSDECISNRKTVIGHDVWIAASAIIKQGIVVGDGAVIGANAFVNKDVPPYAIVVGSPAKVIKYRFSSEQIALLTASNYWEFSPKIARVILAELSFKS